VCGPRRRRRSHDAGPCGVRLESLAYAPAQRRGLGLARARGGAMIDLNALFHRRPAAIVVIGAAVFGALSFLIALRPALDLNAAAAVRPAAGAGPAVARGRALYLAEGCGYCHSQFVRPLFIDAAYGRPSEVADYAGPAPPL